jgi:hypothetical protein
VQIVAVFKKQDVAMALMIVVTTPMKSIVGTSSLEIDKEVVVLVLLQTQFAHQVLLLALMAIVLTKAEFVMDTLIVKMKMYLEILVLLHYLSTIPPPPFFFFWMSQSLVNTLIN